MVSEGLEGAFSSSEETSVEELGEYDLDVNPLDCVRLETLGGAKAE